MGKLCSSLWWNGSCCKSVFQLTAGKGFLGQFLKHMQFFCGDVQMGALLCGSLTSINPLSGSGRNIAAGSAYANSKCSGHYLKSITDADKFMFSNSQA